MSKHGTDVSRHGPTFEGVRSDPVEAPADRLKRRDRLLVIIERDGPTCVWCGQRFGPLVTPTTDHLVPRVKGGPSWAENETAACARCNHRRGHLSPADWLAECERRGWQPDGSRVLESLLRLDAAIRLRGGQRRARPYLAGQLKRLARRNAA